MVTATGIWRDYDIRFSVRPLVKDILPSSFFATTTTSFVWIDPQMIRSSSEYVTQIRKSANQKCIKVEAVSFDVGHFQEQGFGSSRPSLSFMPVSDWVTVHNGPNISCFDLTMGCRDSRSNASQIFNKESDVVTVLLNRRLEFTTGFWLSFKATDFCDWPVIQLSGRSGKFQPHPEWKMKNLFCTWELRKSPNFYPEGFRVKIDNNFSETSKNRFSVFEVGQNEVVKIADVHQDYGRNLWMYLDGGARLEVQILSASENLSPITFDFDYEIVHSFPRQCGAYGLKALASPQLAHTVMYPNFFPRETNCTWIITKDPSVKSSSIVIDFPDFTCDSRMSLKVYTLPLLVSSYRWRLESRTPCFHTHQNRAAASQRYSAEALKIEFTSLDAHPGFEFTYRRGGCVDATIDLTDFVDMSYILHDKLPAEELFGRDCHFRVITEPSHKICVTFEELSLTSYSSSHCRENYFTIIGVGHNENSSLGMFCGAYAEKTSIFSLGNVIELTLHAEARTSLDIVYSITLKSIPPVTCPLTSIVHAGEYFQTLRYTFYPIAHDSSEKCKAWFIKNSDRSKYINVRVETNDFDTLTNGSCTGDHISVDEIDTITSEGSHIHLGTFCSYGYCSHSVNGSVGKSMIITFTVVPPLSGQDFIAYFKLRDPVQDRPESDGSSGSSDTKRIVGGTVGATGVLALGVIFCLWFAWMKKRKETRQANHERQNGTVSVTMNRQESSIYIVRPVIVDTFSSPPPYAAYANHEYDPELPPYPATEHDLSLTYQRQDSPPSYDLVDGADPPPYTEHGSNSHNGNPNQGGEVTSSVSAEQYDNVEVPRASASSNSEPIYELSSRVQYQGQENVYVEPTESSMDEPPEYEFVSPANNSSTMYDNYPPPPPYENLQNLIPMLPTRTRGHTRRGRLGPL
ncbi:uncharacterized protein LOC101862238 [Aplysia californica]|uniref:Uncharacterized protein LOC101862238 n=1 Tax=Aplysia californica TaxID=6500 RepID=A0ABM0JCL6_APLCA|nr:uncharacterized protein LOC101862238 [Aplysia californica]